MIFSLIFDVVLTKKSDAPMTTANFRQIKTNLFTFKTFKMAQLQSCKITYSEAFQTYQVDLELFRERLSTHGKNEFHLVRRILEHHGVFLIDRIDTSLPPNPNVSLYLFSCTYPKCSKVNLQFEFE